jgi:hypothetical protein
MKWFQLIPMLKWSWYVLIPLQFYRYKNSLSGWGYFHLDCLAWHFCHIKCNEIFVIKVEIHIFQKEEA